jgi:hypothetical protein
LIFKRPIITPYRRVNDVLLYLKEFWSRRRWRDPVVSAPAARRDVQVTVLAGDLSTVRPEQLPDIAAGRAEVLGFRFSGSGASLRGPFEAIELEGCGFPRFHEVLASALTKIAGSRLLVVSPDLPGLGLGLLHNYHFGKQLALVAGDAIGEADTDPDWNNPEFLDPAGEAWRRCLAVFAGQVPRESGTNIAVLPAARRFAELFAGFYLKTRSGP